MYGLSKSDLSADCCPDATYKCLACGFKASQPFKRNCPVISSIHAPLKIRTSWKRGKGNPRVGFLTPCLMQGGTERWHVSLFKHWDRCHASIAGVACTGQYDNNTVNQLKQYTPIYKHFDRVIKKSDVLVVWGHEHLQYQLKFDGPVIFVSHGDWARTTLRGSSQVCTHFAAVGKAAIKPYEYWQFKHPVTVINNGIDFDRCKPTLSRDDIRKQLGIPRDKIVIGHLGRFSSEKHIQKQIDAVALLGPEYVWCGFGYNYSFYKQYGQQVLKDRFYAYPHQDAIGNVFRAFDTFLMLSDDEGFGLALAEAMYFGLPIVSTKVGLLHDDLFDKQPTLPTDYTPEDVAKAIKQVKFRNWHPIIEKYYSDKVMAKKWCEYFHHTYNH